MKLTYTQKMIRKIEVRTKALLLLDVFSKDCSIYTHQALEGCLLLMLYSPKEIEAALWELGNLDLTESFDYSDTEFIELSELGEETVKELLKDSDNVIMRKKLKKSYAGIKTLADLKSKIIPHFKKQKTIPLANALKKLKLKDILEKDDQQDI